jgi:NitT/TauT family transport system ATP-binding protein
VESGVGHILHFGCEIMARVSEKVLALREHWAGDNPGVLAALVRALARASEFINEPDNRAGVANIIAHRIGTKPELIVRTLTGVLKTRPEGAICQNDNYIIIGRDGADRPDPVQAAWAYAQIVRWGQSPLSAELRATAQKVFRPDIYDSALGGVATHDRREPRDGIGAFIGPDFNADDIAGHVAAWRTRRAQRPRLSIVR